MRDRFLVALLLLASCTRTPVVAVAPEPPGPVLRRQCSLPVLVAVSDALPLAVQMSALRSFGYWNAALGKALFQPGIIIGDAFAAATPGGITIVDRDDEEDIDGTWANTEIVSEVPSGCIYTTRVLIKASSYEALPPEALETVFRHEAGHVLGLEHRPEAGSLMFPALQDELPQPMSATPGEIEELHARYP